jgi:uncharacterized membrane protein
MGESMNGHSESRSLETLDFLLFIVWGFVLAIDVTWDHSDLAEVLYPPLGSDSGSALVVLSMAVLFAFSAKFILSPPVHYLRWKNSCLYLIILLLVIVPTLTKVWVRSLGMIHPLEIAHDGCVVHTEAAARMLLRGQNPYAANFGDTALADTPTKSMLDHYPYAPLSFLIPAALILPVEALGIFYDQRYVYIVLYILTLVALSRIISDRLLASMVVTFVGLNILLAPNLRFGMNDIYFLAFLFLAFLTFATLWFVRACWYLAFVALALACALKGIAWLIAPFFLIWALKAIPRPQFARGLLLLLLVWLGIQIPFVVWSPADYVKDVLSPEQVLRLAARLALVSRCSP